jgi:predicted Fe-Mo cluster-binding NifX family protein
MRIAIALAQRDITGPIGQSFGRAVYFGILDTEKDSYEYIENTASAHHGGAGVSASQLIIDLKVSILLIPRCGENAFRVLMVAHIDLYETTRPTGIENIKAFEQGKLPRLGASYAGLHKPD